MSGQLAEEKVREGIWEPMQTCGRCRVDTVMAYVIGTAGVAVRVPVLADSEKREPQVVADDANRVGRVQIEFTQLSMEGTEVDTPFLRVIPSGEKADPDAGPIWFVHWAVCPLKKAERWRAKNLD